MTHLHDHPPDPPGASALHRRLLVVVGVLTVAALAGMVLLWPPAASTPTAAPTPSYDGVVRSAEVIDCPTDALTRPRPPCVRAVVEVLDGPDAGATIEVDTGEQGYPSFAAGERVVVVASEGPDGTVLAIADYNRAGALGWLVGLFVVAVLAAGRWHGLRSLVGLGISLLVVTRFLVPAITAGREPLAVALVGAFVVMLVTLYLCHGFTVKTTAALLGTAAALTLTAVLGVLAAAATKLTGLSSEDAQLVLASVGAVDLRGLVLAGLVVGALGVLDDVTVSQASTVFAVHSADPSQSRGDLFRRSIGVGRDHIASTINTLVLAYAGASIPLLLLLSTSGLPLGEIANTELVAEQIVTTLVGSVGLIAAVPLTTALAVAVATTAHPAGAAAPGPRPRPHEDRGDDDWIAALRSTPTPARARRPRGIGDGRGQRGPLPDAEALHDSALLRLWRSRSDRHEILTRSAPARRQPALRARRASATATTPRRGAASRAVTKQAVATSTIAGPDATFT